MSKDPFTVVADGVIGVSGASMIGNTPKPKPPPRPKPSNAAFTLDEEQQIVAYFEGDPAAKGWDTFQKMSAYIYLLEQGIAPALRKAETMVGGRPVGGGSRSPWDGVGKPPQPTDARIIQQQLRLRTIMDAQATGKVPDED